MKTINKIILAAAAVLVVTAAGCKEDELMSFDGDTNVYFTLKRWPVDIGGLIVEYDGSEYACGINGSKSESTDSMAYSFMFYPEEVNKRTVLVPLSIMGRVADTDRKVAYKVLPTSTAKEGDDFKVLDAFIPAERTFGAIIVELTRDNLTKDGKSLEIHFGLERNENFEIDYNMIPFSNTYRDSLVSTVSNFRLQFNDGLTRPELWDPISGYYGDYSQKKLLLMISVLKVPIEHFYPNDGSYPLTPVLTAYGTMLKKWLVQYEIDNGEPYLDENDTPMTAGPMIS